MSSDDDICGGEIDSSTKMINTIASSSRWLFILAVLGTALIATVMFVYGFIVTIYSILEIITLHNVNEEGMKGIVSTFMEVIDLFLVATVFYLTSLGLYELFIAKAPLPGWVKICNLDDLKEKLLGLIIIALAVLFLGRALEWTGDIAILYIGLGVGAMIAAISLYIWIKH